MIARTLLLIAILMFTLPAQAAWDAGGGLENYQWQEYDTGNTGNPKESGLRSALFVNWTQDADQGPLFAWRAKLYAGTVNYDTFVMCAAPCTNNGAAVSTRTDYGGATSEGQFIYRKDLGAYRLDYLGGLGLDIWRRSIRNGGGDQIEDYSILFLRAGLRLAKSRRDPGMHGELGIKYPVSTNENAHLDSAGYTTNPALSPKGAVSGYAELGYRINATFDVVGYYDSWRFRRSANVTVQDSSGILWNVWQPKSSMDALGAKLLVSF